MLDQAAQLSFIPLLSLGPGEVSKKEHRVGDREPTAAAWILRKLYGFHKDNPLVLEAGNTLLCEPLLGPFYQNPRLHLGTQSHPWHVHLNCLWIPQTKEPCTKSVRTALVWLFEIPCKGCFCSFQVCKHKAVLYPSSQEAFVLYLLGICKKSISHGDWPEFKDNIVL